jgi:methylated-DNA-[protein]-cysteine S-methyltransferase
MTLYGHRMPSPFGDLGLMVDAAGRLVRIAFLEAGESFEPPNAGDQLIDDPARTAEVERQLAEYFAGDRDRFDLELAPEGTEFQKRVWSHLCEIPAGETRTYSEIARRLGRPGAARAVGRANATNPIPIVVPCHRVIGADGTLTGYAGGLPIKRGLLEIEGVELERRPEQLTLVR